jgi:hypothetical protein
MALHSPLSPELEAQAQDLLARLRPQAEADLLALARLLVSKKDSDVFGTTEFQVRDIVHRLGANALEERLKKRSATKAPASIAPPVPTPPNSRATVRKRRSV